MRSLLLRVGTFVLLTAALAACQGLAPAPDVRAPRTTAPLPALIPAPVQLERLSGAFEVTPDALLTVAPGDAAARAVAQRFAELVQRSSGARLDAREGDGAIRFVIDPAFSAGGDHADEAYDLSVTPRAIVLTARSAHGLFNGATTLWQLLTPAGAQPLPARIPALHIVDFPRFAWRGLLLDSARHLQSPAAIKRLIDAMAVHKLDVLHWHLTDDQGWRIEIKRYPRLTSVGAWRAPQPDEMDLVDPATGQYGGYYTQEQIRDIVRYAGERFVTIVPEIDMPGHAQAALAAYPRLGVTGRQPTVSSDWGIHTWLFGVDEPTFGFIENVLAEVTDLFPSPYIHIGGDEAAKDQWQASARVQAQMRRLGIADEEGLQGYFTWRLDRMLQARGRHLIGWDEILESGLPPGATIMSWRGSEGAVAAAQHGDDVVMTPDPGMYFDHLQSDAPGQPPGRVKPLTLADVYAFDPTPAGLDAVAARHVLGAQANLWSEYLTTPERVEYTAFPRAAALAERVWSARADWNGFVARLPALFARYRILGVAYADAAVAPQATLAVGAAGDAATVTLTQQLAFGTMRYTLDGAEPTPASPAYAGPLHVTLPASVRAATFVGGAPVSGAILQRVDATALSRRSSDELRSCTSSLLLRLEGRSEPGGEAPRYNVDLMNPCWIYPQVDFSGLQRIDARIGALPYFFQLWHEAAKVVTHPAPGAADELQAHLDTCEGPLLGSVPLTDAAGAVQTVSVAATGQAGTHDVCFFFATHGRDPLRLVDWIEPVHRR